jgi:hypothetical protein
MGVIASWMEDQLQQEEAKLIQDDTLLNLKQSNMLLDQIAPFETYDSRNFVQYITERIAPTASIIAFGAKVPVTQQGQFRKLMVKLFKSGLAYLYDEDQQWDMKEAMELAQLKGVGVQNNVEPDGTPVQGTNNTLADFIFGTVKDLTVAQVVLLNSLMWQALQFGEVAYTDPRVNTSVFLDYKDSGASYNHFPAALSGSNLWTNYANANGLSDLENDIETYIDTNGKRPDMIIMSRKLRRHLLNQETTKQAAGSIRNSAASLTINAIGSLNVEMLSNVMSMRDLPPIVIMDDMYKIEDSNKNTTNARYLNTDRYVFASLNMGERAMGPTLESGGAPGVFVETKQIENFPVVDATQAVATLLPVVANPKLLFSRKVA